MRTLNFFTIALLSLGLGACGGKENSTGTSTFSADPYKVTTVSGYVPTQQPVFEAGGKVYQLSQQSYQIMSSAFQVAQQQGIQPTLIGGVYKYKARVTGSLAPSSNQPYMPQPGQAYSTSTSTTLNVTQAVITR